jgi:alpha-tubulin suppressor-like RCC1 family protein
MELLIPSGRAGILQAGSVRVSSIAYLTRLFVFVVGTFLALAAAASGQVATPVFVPDAGDSAIKFSVTVTCSTPGSSIYYTTDGTDPTESSPAVPGDGKVLVARNLTLKARAYASGLTPSAVKSAAYRVTGALYGGGAHVILLKSNQRPYGWGSQGSGRLGNGVTSGNVSAPQNFTRLSGGTILDAVDAAGGYQFSLIVDSTGKAWACGENASGQLGDNTTGDRIWAQRILKADVTLTSSTPESDLLTGISTVAAGRIHSLFVEGATGKVYAVGQRNFGRLGDGYTSSTSSLRRYATLVTADNSGNPLLGAVQVAAGEQFSVALVNPDSQGRGQVYSWGRNDLGQLGLGSSGVTNLGTSVTANQGRAVQAKANAAGTVLLNDVVDLAAGYDHAVAVRRDAGGVQTAWCWGEQANGRLGNGLTSQAAVRYPNQVYKDPATYGSSQPLTNIVRVAAGPRHSVALDGAGRVWSWGNNNDGNLGHSGTTHTPYAKEVQKQSGGALDNIVAITAGGYQTYDVNGVVTAVNGFTLAIDVNGQVYAWGYNGQGEFCNGTTGTGAQSSAVLATSAPKASNVAPVVGTFSVTSPTSPLVAPATITLTANPSDVDGDLGGVDFYENGVFLQRLTAAPWSITLTNRAANTYSYQAIAFDTPGATASASGGLTVPNPVLTIISGNNQTSAANAFVADPLVVEVRAGAGGALLVNRQVTFTVTGGGGVSATQGGATQTSLPVNTLSPSGRASVYFKQPTQGNFASQVAAVASHGLPVTFTATTNALVGHWQLNESSGTTASDASGASNPGSISNDVNAFWTKGYNWTGGPNTGGVGVKGDFYAGQTGLLVSNTGNRVLPATGQPFSFTMWFRANQLVAGNLYNLFSNETYLQDGLRIGIDTGQYYTFGTPALMVWSTQSGGTMFTRSSSVLSASRWYHLAVTYSGTTAKVYLDGALLATQTATILGNTNSLRFGAGIGGCRNLEGALDDVRVYHKELTGTEVTAIRDSLTDGDTLPDQWEREKFGDLSKSPTSDTDADGLNELGEYNAGTNPNNPDTDGDTLTDGFEVANGLNPLNPDSDGNGSGDANEDLDGDGLTNVQELQYGTNPTNADTDGDTMNDKWEITWSRSPTVWNNPNVDTDSDGMNDGNESQYGRNPNAGVTQSTIPKLHVYTRLEP